MKLLNQISQRIEEKMTWKIGIALGVLLILSLSIIWYANTKTCLFFDCILNYKGLAIPVDCNYVEQHKEQMAEIFFNSFNFSMTTTTKPNMVDYHCPDCPTCPECVKSTCPTTTTTLINIPKPPDYVNTSGGNYYSTKPSSIDFKWQKCNPLENVTYNTYNELKPMFENITNCTTYNTTDEHDNNITALNCTTYYLKYEECSQQFNSTKLANCTTYFYRTNQTLNYLRNSEIKTLKGGCVVVPTSCCTCYNGGYVDAINIELYSKYYSEVLKNCSGMPVVCPMQMRSPIGCNPVAACQSGVCTIVNR